MADARLYIVNEDTGVAVRFYSRSGSAYQLGDFECMKVLLEHVADKTAISDRFFITDSEAEIERIDDGPMFRFVGKSPLPDEAWKSPLFEENKRLRKQIEELLNERAMLGRQLIAARERHPPHP